jgi:hypothetical protein
MFMQQIGDDYWYPNTGATNHLAMNEKYFANKSLYQGSDSIMIGNGKTLPISHTEDMVFLFRGYQFSLKNVLHVAVIAKNLLSVGQFTKDNYCIFKFTTSHFIVKDR